MTEVLASGSERPPRTYATRRWLAAALLLAGAVLGVRADRTTRAAEAEELLDVVVLAEATVQASQESVLSADGDRPAEVARWLPRLDESAQLVEGVDVRPWHGEVAEVRRSYAQRVRTLHRLLERPSAQARGEAGDARRTARDELTDLVGPERAAATLGRPR